MKERAPVPLAVPIERVDQRQSSPERIPLAPEPTTAERPLATTSPAPYDKTFSDQTTSSDSASSGSVKPAPYEKTLPDWTRSELTVLVDAQIPDVLLVRKSRPSATEAEAVSEARSLAIAALKQRLAASYPGIDSWSMPVEVFQTHSFKQQFVQRKLHNFGSFEEPMFVAYVQFEDAPGIREPIVEAWHATQTDGLVKRYGIGFAIMTLSLAALSAGLRTVSSSNGQSRHRAVAIAIVLAVLVTAMFVA